MAEPYVDWNEVANWAKDAVLKCKELGIMVGSNGEFNPKDELTREQAAGIVCSMLKYLGK
jgi:hypothetical protein